jgi:hypothetical protein
VILVQAGRLLIILGLVALLVGTGVAVVALALALFRLAL